MVHRHAKLTLEVLECYLKDGPALSLKQLCRKISVSKKKIIQVVHALEERGYLKTTGKSEEYVLGKKITLLV